MTDHACQCCQCRPEAFPSGPRQGEHHVGIRLGDQSGDEWRCLLDGRDIANETNELYAGREGWAVLYSQPVHRCERCLIGVCQYVAHGVVSIARMALV